MKKLVILVSAVILSVFGVVPSFATTPGSILDQIDAAFVGHAKLGYEYTTEATNQVQFLDNFVEIGHLEGNPIGALDLGILATIQNPNGHLAGGDFSTGGKVHLMPFVKRFIVLPSEWQFLQTLEIDVRGSYDWTQRKPFYGLAAGYPFK
jgi:hypothetical protein